MQRSCIRVFMFGDIRGLRNFSMTMRRSADEAKPESRVSQLLRNTSQRSGSPQQAQSVMVNSQMQRVSRARPDPLARGQASSRFSNPAATGLFSAELGKAHPITVIKNNPPRKIETRYILHCLFGRNNLHLTLTAEYRDVANPYSMLEEHIKLSKSTGNAGFKKSERGEPEAVYRLTVYFFNLMIEKGFTDKPIEIVLRNHGRLRRAFLDVLTGREGARIRRLVNRVTDGTRLRHGGVRPPARRRL
ncbi:hypothetical protein V1512DRAFT_264696 [Lipomyces arxii]|uniref:uncharacterized protein n=1 Tax=Lipomyces arxii TaxID=56418 RepID=UPI0034CD0708